MTVRPGDRAAQRGDLGRGDAQDPTFRAGLDHDDRAIVADTGALQHLELAAPVAQYAALRVVAQGRQRGARAARAPRVA